MFVSFQAYAQQRVRSAGRAYVGKYVRPNSKSSLRYFATSPERRCITGTKTTTPSSAKSLTPKRELSIGQIGTGLWKKARWGFTSREDKKTELFTALASNILHRNADNSLTSIINLFKSEDLLNEPQTEGHALTPLDLTPLAFAIEFSSNSDTDYQKNLIDALVENGAQLHGTKELDLAFKHYNLGAIQALLPYYSESALSDFYSRVRKSIEAQEKELDMAQGINYKKLLQKRITKLKRIEQLLETKTTFFPFEKESELK